MLALLCGLASCSRETTDSTARSLAAAPPAAVGEGRRIALVVGNGRYASAPLVNPANDAELISMTLMQVGFEVRLVQDGDQRAMKRAIQEFGATLESAGPTAVGLFYYAGHGVQLNGRNYLIPVAAEIERDADVEIEAVSADWVLEQMRYARNRLNFVILDACRNNPFARSFRSADRGLAKMDAPAGVLIAYSTAPGDVAADGDGGNSPYSEALATAMRESGEPAELMFKRVRDQVRRTTTDRQTPWESSSLTGDNFYFASRAVPAPVEAGGVPPATPSTTRMTQATPPSDPVPDLVPNPVRNPDNDSRTATVWPPVDGDLCTRAPGTWQVDSETIPGTVQLTADHRAIVRLRDSRARTATWDCDAPNRRLRILLDDGTAHMVTMDFIERLIFGYDQDGTALTYNR
jgi:hypothetical protein